MYHSVNNYFSEGENLKKEFFVGGTVERWIAIQK